MPTLQRLGGQTKGETADQEVTQRPSSRKRKHEVAENQGLMPSSLIKEITRSKHGYSYVFHNAVANTRIWTPTPAGNLKDSLSIQISGAGGSVVHASLSLDPTWPFNIISGDVYELMNSFKFQMTDDVPISFVIEGILEGRRLYSEIQDQNFDFEVDGVDSRRVSFGFDMIQKLGIADYVKKVQGWERSEGWAVASNERDNEGVAPVEAHDQRDSQTTKTKTKGNRIVHKSEDKDWLTVSYTISEDRTGDETSVKRALLAPLARGQDFNPSKLFLQQERPSKKFRGPDPSSQGASRSSRLDLLRVLK